MAAPDRAGGLVPEPSSLVTSPRAPVNLGMCQRAHPPGIGTGRLPASEGRQRARGSLGQTSLNIDPSHSHFGRLADHFGPDKRNFVLRMTALLPEAGVGSAT
jgi:hypothetical protein